MDKQTTTEMAPELREELVRLGWGDKLAHLEWGRRMSGDMHGAEVERNGKIRYITGPFTAVRGGGQIAIVRRG